MPHIIYTPKALDDLIRLANFLKTRSPEAAKRAIAAIKSDIEKAQIYPQRFRPVPEMPHYREIVIDFGSYGYVVRFRHEAGGDLYVVRIKHQREDGFES